MSTHGAMVLVAAACGTRHCRRGHDHGTECMTDMASKVPAGVVYAEDLSRPEQRDQRLELGLDLEMFRLNG